MNDKDCGYCDYQGDFVTPQGIECMVDQKVHERGYRCEGFKTHVPGKNQIVRLEQARAKREEREAKASEERNREFAEKMAEKDRECADKIARINREHDEKLQQKGMAFERRQRRTSFWRQVVLAVFSALLGFIVGWLLKS